MSAEQRPKFFTVKQAARQLCLTEEVTRKKIREGVLKCCPRKVGTKKIYLRQQDIDDYFLGEGKR